MIQNYILYLCQCGVAEHLQVLIEENFINQGKEFDEKYINLNTLIQKLTVKIDLLDINYVPG